MFKLILLSFVLSGSLFVASISGKVIKVSDGDTITLLSPGNEQIKIRLAGIDAPEKSQEYGENHA